jgi:copper chaperone
VQETFNVPDVHCGHCKSAIEGALQPLGGIERAEVDVDGRQVTVGYDDSVIDRASVVQAIQSAGYPVSV